MMSMAGTYYGTNLTKNEYNVELELKQGVKLSQLAAGVGSTIREGCPTKVPPMGCHDPGGRCYNWTEARCAVSPQHGCARNCNVGLYLVVLWNCRLQSFASFLVGQGVTQLDIWRADIDMPTDCTEPWVFEVAERFLNGTMPPLLPAMTS